MNIYKQMNMIDDNKSLDKRRNMKNQREVKHLKEHLQKLDETNPLVKDIEEYIHNNIFEWNTIGFEDDHIYVVFDDTMEDYTIDSCQDELVDEFRHVCELEFEIENEKTLLIYVSISDEVDDENYEWFVEQQVDYGLRAKDAQIKERDYGYEFLWISQERLSEDDAYELAVATNNYLVHLNRVGKLVKGTCYCRSYPEGAYKVQFTVKENLRFAEVEDATVYEYGIIDDSEYFEEEYTTDWNKALETFKNTVQNVQKRLLDMDKEKYDDYYSDGVVVRMIKGKEGSDAFDWDTIRTVTVFRDSIENEEDLKEEIRESLDLTEATKDQEVAKITDYLHSKGYSCIVDRDNIRVQLPSGREYDIVLEPTGTSKPSGVKPRFTPYRGDGVVTNGQLYDNNQRLIGKAGVSVIRPTNDKDYKIKNIDKVII